MRRAKTALLVTSCVALALGSVPSGVHAQSTAPNLDDFLRSTVGLGASQIAEARKGVAAVTLLHAAISRDVAVFGMVGIHTTRDAYVARIRDMPTPQTMRNLGKASCTGRLNPWRFKAR